MNQRVSIFGRHLLICAASIYLAVYAYPGNSDRLLDAMVTSDRNEVRWLRDISARVESNEGVFELSDPRYQRSQIERSADDAFGVQPWTVVIAKDTKGVLDLQWSIRKDVDGIILVKLACTNRTDKPIRIDKFIVVDGFRSGEWGGYALSFGPRGVSPLKKDVELGGIYATTTNRPGFVGGFVTTSHYLGIVNVKPIDGGLKVTAINPADGVRLPSGASRESEPVWMSPGRHPSVELEHWGDLAGRWNNARFSPRPYATWCTWYSGLNNWQDKENGVLEKFTLANLPLLAEIFGLYGLECIRLTENSLGRGQGDWPFLTNALPSGYPELARTIEKHGMIMGFWTDIHRVGVYSKTFKEHPEWLVKDREGKPEIYKGSLPNHGAFGIIDASVGAARDYYYQFARRFREAGARNYFVDYLSETIVGSELLSNPEMTGIEASRRVLESLRDGFGQEVYILSQAMPAAFYGVVDAMRIAIDSWGKNITSYTTALSSWFMNRRVILCDPDTMLLLKYDLEWNRTWGSWSALSGGAMTVGVPIENVYLNKLYDYSTWRFRELDKPAPPRTMADHGELTPQHVELLRRLLPPLASTGRPRDLWERVMPVTLEQSLEVRGEKWRVLALTNYRDIPIHITLNLDRLWDENDYSEQGFPGKPNELGTTDRRYLIYDFWAEKCLGEFAGTADFEVPAMKGKVVVIREARNRPQILAIRNHIGQGIEELKGSSWDSEAKTLGVTTQGRRGVVNTTARIRVPPGYQVVSVKTDGKALEWSLSGEEVCLFTIPDREKEAKCRITFEGSIRKKTQLLSRPVEPGLIAEVNAIPGSREKE